MITKEEIQKRVLKDGKPLELDKFTWCEKTNTFSTTEDGLVLDFSDLSNCFIYIRNHNTITAGNSNTITAEDSNTITAEHYNTIRAEHYNTITARNSNTITAEDSNTITARDFNTITARNSNTITARDYNTITARDYNTITARDFNTITAGYSNTITARDYNTITAGYSNTITAGNSNTITARDFNTITARNSNTITAGKECVYIRTDIFEVITLEQDKKYQIAPYKIKGYLKDGIYSETGKKSVITDGILSEVIKEKGNILHVKNHGEDKISYIVKDGDVYSHGATLEEAKKSLKYKISNRDTTQYKDHTLDTKLSLTDLIRCYRVITGACESGAKYFIEQNKIEDKEYSIKEFIDITKGQYGNETFAKFFSK
jgi:hypothetical protein